MGLDTISYLKLSADTFEKKVFKEDILYDQKAVSDAAFEIGCLEAQISDFKAGTSDTPEEQAIIDAAILNYEEAIVELKS